VKKASYGTMLNLFAPDSVVLLYVCPEFSMIIDTKIYICLTLTQWKRISKNYKEAGECKFLVGNLVIIFLSH